MPIPRISNFYGSKRSATVIGNTWIEPEEFCYSSRDGSAMNRRAYVLDGSQLRLVRCCIPDTYFSIPATARISGVTVKGYITSDESGFKFNRYQERIERKLKTGEGGRL